MLNRYEQRGSATIGFSKFKSTSFIWPFASLTATDCRITLKVLWFGYQIDEASITTVKPYNSFFLTLGKGIQIIHTSNDCPEFIVFWSFNRKKLLSVLQRLGYPIDDSF